MKIKEYYDRGNLEELAGDPLLALPKVKEYKNRYGNNKWIQNYEQKYAPIWERQFQTGYCDNAKEEVN